MAPDNWIDQFWIDSMPVYLQCEIDWKHLSWKKKKMGSHLLPNQITKAEWTASAPNEQTNKNLQSNKLLSQSGY